MLLHKQALPADIRSGPPHGLPSLIAHVEPGKTLTPQAEAKYNEGLAVKGEHVDALQYLASLEMERAKLAAGINVGNRCIVCSLVFQPGLASS